VSYVIAGTSCERGTRLQHLASCRAAGPQCDQKVNKDFRPILWDSVYRIVTSCSTVPEVNRNMKVVVMMMT